MAEPWLAETASNSRGGGPASANWDGWTSGLGFRTTSPKGAKASGVSGWAVMVSANPCNGNGLGPVLGDGMAVLCAAAILFFVSKQAVAQYAGVGSSGFLLVLVGIQSVLVRALCGKWCWEQERRIKKMDWFVTIPSTVHGREYTGN